MREWTMEGMTVTLHLEAEAGQRAAGQRPSDPGRIPEQSDVEAGPTTLVALEPPAGLDPPAATPRLWLVAAGASPAWRRAELLLSRDGGGSYDAVGIVGPGAIAGRLSTPLANGPADVWDLAATVDVELLADAMALSGRPDAALWDGANLAIVGDELIQFSFADQIGPRHWRLHRLLRGRRGSSAGPHPAGVAFALLASDTVVAVDLPLSAVGTSVLVKAVGPADAAGDVQAVPVFISGRSVRPLSPARLDVAVTPLGDMRITWVRRSRDGFAWIDGADTPLAEEREAYRLTIGSGPNARIIESTVSAATYLHAERLSDGFASPLAVEVRQLGAGVGAGDAIVQQFALVQP